MMRGPGRPTDLQRNERAWSPAWKLRSQLYISDCGFARGKIDADVVFGMDAVREFYDLLRETIRMKDGAVTQLTL